MWALTKKKIKNFLKIRFSHIATTIVVIIINKDKIDS